MKETITLLFIYIIVINYAKCQMHCTYISKLSLSSWIINITIHIHVHEDMIVTNVMNKFVVTQ